MISRTSLRLRSMTLAGLASCALCAGPALQAQEHGHDDYDLARQALEQGKVLPLRTVLDQIEREYGGQVVKVEFERDDGRFVYDIRLLQKDGRVAKLTVDASDGRVLAIKRKHP